MGGGYSGAPSGIFMTSGGSGGVNVGRGYSAFPCCPGSPYPGAQQGPVNPAELRAVSIAHRRFFRFRKPGHHLRQCPNPTMTTQQSNILRSGGTADQLIFIMAENYDDVPFNSAQEDPEPAEPQAEEADVSLTEKEQRAIHSPYAAPASSFGNHVFY